MAVLTAPAAPLSPALPQAAGPACTLQRTGSLWQLGIEAQELTTAIAQLAEQLEADDDTRAQPPLGELEAALLAEEGNKTALAAKADATCWVIEHLRGQAAYRQQQAKRLTELSRSDASRADALEDSLVLVLTRLQPSATRFSFPNHELTSRKSQAVEIDDEDALDSQWLSFTTTSKPDKAAIKEALKAGREITGVQLISRRFGWRFAPADKVMQVANDYEKEVFNGDVGTVETIDADASELTVRFDGREVTYGWGELDNLVPAYACTIHKSQGSEYPTVVIPLLTQHYPMLQRNLVYTGITRGKQLVVLVGQKKALAMAVKNHLSRRRYTKLAEWLGPS